MAPAPHLLKMDEPAAEEEAVIQQQVKWTQRRSGKSRKEFGVFQYTHNTGKKGSFSCWYPSRSHAARAGDNWHSKVVRSAPQAPSPPKKKEDDLEAPLPQQVDMTQPLTQLEFHIVKHAACAFCAQGDKVRKGVRHVHIQRRMGPCHQIQPFSLVF